MKLIIQIEIEDKNTSRLSYKTFRDAFQFTLDGCRAKVNSGDYGLNGEKITETGIIYRWNVIPQEDKLT